MNGGQVPWWATLLVAIIPLGGSYFAYRQATKAANATAAVEFTKVDAEAYTVAKHFYEDMLAERKSESAAQQAQITSLNNHVIQLQTSLNEMQHQLNGRLNTETDLRSEVARLGLEVTSERQVNRRLTARVEQLEAVVRAAGGQLPPPPL